MPLLLPRANRHYLEPARPVGTVPVPSQEPVVPARGASAGVDRATVHTGREPVLSTGNH
jgi:hypothetical protein